MNSLLYIYTNTRNTLTHTHHAHNAHKGKKSRCAIFIRSHLSVCSKVCSDDGLPTTWDLCTGVWREWNAVRVCAYVCVSVSVCVVCGLVVRACYSWPTLMGRERAREKGFSLSSSPLRWVEREQRCGYTLRYSWLGANMGIIDRRLCTRHIKRSKIETRMLLYNHWNPRLRSFCQGHVRGNVWIRLLCNTRLRRAILYP